MLSHCKIELHCPLNSQECYHNNYHRRAAGEMKKGDVLTVAQIAGINGAKQTSNLIPLCHPLPLTHISVEFVLDESLPGVQITASTRLRGKTGVEMEALTAVSVAALTIYDMAKAAEKTMGE